MAATRLNPPVTNSIMVKNFSASGMSQSANGHGFWDVDVSLEGYTPLGVVGSGCPNHADAVTMAYWTLQSTKLSTIWHSRVSFALSDSQLFVTVLYVKNG